MIDTGDVISIKTQYLIYAGTKRDDFSGWTKIDVPDDDRMEIWALDIGGGYVLQRAVKKVKGIFGERTLRSTALRHDRSIVDPDSDYTDSCFTVLLNVKMTVDDATVKFESKNNSYTVISRAEVDWKEFESGEPVQPKEDNSSYSSFYS